ncbi:hypothetical protein [Schinkia azotoformans]|uniref:hypothetical protein n=1 Tax=Schinkia azotoformans TaxID=1454 RepID=UPI002DC00012|nr:hypothetical protein [Schinkia azotoformans]MEC1757394.1 hypothetical protein [Schinkia azotoformans]
MENIINQEVEVKDTNLSKQVFIYSLSTDCFLNDVEHELHKEKQLLDMGKKYYKDVLKKLEDKDNITKKEIDAFFKKLSFGTLANKYRPKSHLIDFFMFKIDGKSVIDDEIELELIELLNQSPRNQKAIRQKKTQLFKLITDRVNELKDKLDEEADKHKGVRRLREEYLVDSNKVAQFESTLTRALGVDEGKTTTDIIMIRAYRYKVFKSIVENGFIGLNNEKYQYLTSSAGMIRNKKSIFMKNEVYDNVQGQLFAGLTDEIINSRGGMNPNKYNAYTALALTSSTVWKEFESENLIDHAIVVDDFETDVIDEVDYIDKNYKITRGKKPVTIPHSDGAGIMLSSVSEKALQIRLPFFKGLLIPTPYDKFIKKYKDASPIVKDIYGKEWDVIKDDIRIIFTRSQFKAWKYWINDNDVENSWSDYRKAFKDNKCEAAIAHTEEDEETFCDKTLSYQILQTLNMTKEELEGIASRTVSNIKAIGKDLNVMMEALGITKENKSKNYFQQALEIYPNLINDEHSRQVIKDTKKSMTIRAKSGKLLVESKRTFISPDVFAFMEWLFAGKENPKGLLENGEVSCKLYDDKQKLDCLRSPHLYKEHSVNVNKVDENTNEWFITNCIYTSVHSLITKVLMNDVDGDECFIVSQKDFVEIAERNMKNIRPLDYELASGKAEEITKANIYKNLIEAYKKNIGEYSNLISSIWNSNEIKDDKFKDEAIKVIRWLTYENNAAIDYAKSLWFPTRPPEVDEIIKKYTKKKSPYFMIYSNDKTKKQVEAKNNSTVNMLDDIVPSTRSRIVFEKVKEEHDYKKLLNNASVSLETEIAKEIIETYDKLNKNKYKDIKKQAKKQGKSMKKVKYRVIDDIRDALRNIIQDDIYITDVLVKYLYENNSPNKDTLWDAFGHVIVWNLKRNVMEIVECLDCKCEIEKTKQRQVRCTDCQNKRNKYLEKMRKRKNRSKKKVS